VENVAWVWCVNGDRSGGKDWPDYYPGDEYVDWLAIDIYSSRNPREIMRQFVEMYGATGKPMMIPEGGTGPEQTQWNKQFKSDAAWVKELFDVIDETPQMKALCWFQWGGDWNLERDADQLKEYQRRIREPRFAAPFVGK
jgi:beta-mannanase